MQYKVKKYIDDHKLLLPQGIIIVGVSGGADSMVLLHLLIALGYDCVIAHCNFHLRKEESDSDEFFVRNFARSLKIPFYSIDFETTEYAAHHHISIEMAARDLRYAWFHELLKKLDAQAIAVAHHADDSIETFLMNLVRGTGLRGLTGIAPRNGKVVRPLLCCTRNEIENYIIEYNLEHINDSSNATLDYQRNKFRNVVLPLLEEINPSVRQTLYQTMERFEGTLAIYDHAIDKIEKEIIHNEDEAIFLNIELLKKQVDIPTVMYEILNKYGFGNATVQQVTEHLDGESGKQFFSDTHRLIKDRKYLIINKIEPKIQSEYWISITDTEIAKPFRMVISKHILTPEFQISKDKNCIHLDASKLQFPLQLRHWHEGDSFIPFGMKGSKKVSDFFIDNKFTLLEKEQVWLLVSGDDIVWIVGHRTDNRCRVTKETKEVVQLII